MQDFHVSTLLRTPGRGQQIHKEREHIKCKYQRNHPLEHSRDILLAVEGSGGESDSKDDFGDDESKLHPEGKAQDGVLTEVNSQALVLGADEDGADNVTGYEEEEEAVVEVRVVQGVEDGEED